MSSRARCAPGLSLITTVIRVTADAHTPPSAIGRLLDEISWEGNARKYRDGGIGKENVSTTEVFSALGFLPRTAFLGAVIAAAVGADAARAALIADIEVAAVEVLSGDLRPAKRRTRHVDDPTGRPHQIWSTAGARSHQPPPARQTQRRSPPSRRRRKRQPLRRRRVDPRGPHPTLRNGSSPDHQRAHVMRRATALNPEDNAGRT